MSYRVVAAVLDFGPPDPMEALLLIAIAEYGNDLGYAWPGVEKLSRRCRRSYRQTLRLIQRVAKDGWLKILSHAEGAGRKQTAYQLDLSRLQLSCDTTMSGDKASSADILGGSHVTPEPFSCDILPIPILINHRTIEPTVAGAPGKDLFPEDETQVAEPRLPMKPAKLSVSTADAERVWRAYPSKQGSKKKALELIKRAAALLAAKGIADPIEYLIGHISRWLTFRKRLERAGKFTPAVPLATTYFGREQRFLNEDAWNESTSQAAPSTEVVRPRTANDKIAAHRSAAL